MEQAVIVDAIRTRWAVRRAARFRNVRAEDLSAHHVRALLARNPSLTAATLDDILLGLRTTKRWSKASTLPVTPRAAGRNSHSGTGGRRQPSFRWFLDAGVKHDAARMTGDRRCAGLSGWRRGEHMGHVPMTA